MVLLNAESIQAFHFIRPCDWPTAAAARANTICDVGKLIALYLKKLTVQFWHFTQNEIQISCASSWLLVYVRGLHF